MSDIIKMGTEVWGEVPNGWEGFYRYVGKEKCGSYMVWCDQAKEHLYFPEVTTEDPTTPKQPSYIPEGCELWECEDGLFFEGPNNKLLNYSSLMNEYLPRIVGFALQSGTGSVEVCSSPIGYTLKALKGVSNSRFEPYTDNAKLLGVVMRSKQ